MHKGHAEVTSSTHKSHQKWHEYQTNAMCAVHARRTGCNEGLYDTEVLSEDLRYIRMVNTVFALSTCQYSKISFLFTRF